MAELRVLIRMELFTNRYAVDAVDLPTSLQQVEHGPKTIQIPIQETVAITSCSNLIPSSCQKQNLMQIMWPDVKILLLR
ncbi:hypothetical protein D3C86_1783710 [compost metagenome]